MQVVINHLTRMEHPRICVAGIDPESHRHIRPVTGAEHPLTRVLLHSAGGPFEIGAMVDLGDIAARPVIPEVEDHAFYPAQARHLAMLPPVDYLEVLDAAAESELEAIFGSELERVDDGWKMAVEKGKGEASLGCFRPRVQPRIEVNKFGRPTLRLNEWSKPVFAPVNDLRVYAEDQRTPEADVVADIDRRLRRGVPVRVMVGLPRAYHAPSDDRERHWLQVNGLCLEDQPLGSAP